MPFVQTDYNRTQAPAIAGLVADLEQSDIISRTAEVDIDFGKPAVRGGADNLCRPGDGASQRFLGISVRDVTIDPSKNPNKYSTNDTVSIIRKGPIWVTASVAVSQGDVVHYDHSNEGAWTNTSGANTTEVTNAEWDTTAGAGELAIIRLR